MAYSWQQNVSRGDMSCLVEAVKSGCAFSISLCIDPYLLASWCQGFHKATCWRWLSLSMEGDWVPEWSSGAEPTDHIELWQQHTINFHCAKSLRFWGYPVTAVSISWYSCAAQCHGLCRKTPSSSTPEAFNSLTKIRVGFFFCLLFHF